MPTIKGAAKRFEELFKAKYGAQVVFCPPSEDEHGLLHAFQLAPYKDPVATGKLADLLTVLNNAKFHTDLAEASVPNADKDLAPFVVVTSGKNEGDDGLKVKGAFKKVAGGKLGVTAEKDIVVEANVQNIHKSSLSDMKVYDLVKKYAIAYLQTSGRIVSQLESTLNAGAEIDVIVGFEYEHATCDGGNIRLEADGLVDVGLGVTVAGLTPSVGDTKKTEKEVEHKNVKGTIGAKFVVAHIRKVFQGTVYESVGDFRLMQNPVFVDDLDGDELLNVFYNTSPSLLKSREQIKRSVRGKIFRGFRGQAAQNTQAQEEELDRLNKLLNDDDGERGEVIVSSRIKGYLTETDFIAEFAHPCSSNFVLTGPKKKLALLHEQLEIRGVAPFGGHELTGMSTIRDLDMTGFLPIYYDSTRHLGFDAPTYVLCYDIGKPGYWCFRPVVATRQIATVVTIYDTVWKVCETVVLIRDTDASLQHELEQIGFHVLQPQQQQVALSKRFAHREGGLVMGRHELTPRSESMTPLPSDTQFVNGFLCKKGLDDAAASLPLVDTGGKTEFTTPDSGGAPPAPVVTNITYEEGASKKQKMEDDS